MMALEQQRGRAAVRGLLLVGLMLAVMAACAARIFGQSEDRTVPAAFRVRFNTTQGDLHIYVNRTWGPFGVDRFYELVKSGYYSENGIFRVVRDPEPFVAQWGINGDPAISGAWKSKEIPNDEMVPGLVPSNLRGYVAFAAEYTKNPANNSFSTCCRTTQLYLNFGNNSRLDKYGFTPFGFVEDEKEMENVADRFYSGYGDDKGPDQERIYSSGNAYLKKTFPALDYITVATVIWEEFDNHTDNDSSSDDPHLEGISWVFVVKLIGIAVVMVIIAILLLALAIRLVQIVSRKPAHNRVVTRGAIRLENENDGDLEMHTANSPTEVSDQQEQDHGSLKLLSPASEDDSAHV